MKQFHENKNTKKYKKELRSSEKLHVRDEISTSLKRELAKSKL